MKKLNSKIAMPVIDRYGYSLDTRILRNSPLAELYPKESAVIIHWMKCRLHMFQPVITF
jgi:hypothetical protein